MPLEVSFTQHHQGSLLKITFSIRSGKAKGTNRTDGFKIDGLAEIWFLFNKNAEDLPNASQTTKVLIRVCKQKTAKDASVKLYVICEAPKYSKQFDCPEISTYWIDTFAVPHSSEAIPVEIALIVSKTEPITFTKLYYDTDVTDFHLCTAEGSSVAVHKACLAAHSDVFKAMLNGEWKEAVEGAVQLKGVTLETLQHLKDYMYLGVLPDEGLQPLLQIAKCYMIENLKDDCIMKLAQTVTFLNLFPLLQFACENNLPELSFMMFQLTPSPIIHSAHQLKKLKHDCKIVVDKET